MFVNAYIPGEQIPSPGVLLYVSDPNMLLIPEEGYPPFIRLQKDVKLFVTAGSLPTMTFISTVNKNKDPIVYEGALQVTGKDSFKLFSSSVTIEIKAEFKDESRILLRHLRNAIDNPPLRKKLPLLVNDDAGKPKLTWYARAKARHSNSGIVHAQAWISGLSICFGLATQKLLKMMQWDKETLKAALLQKDGHEHMGDSSPREDYWVWWPCAKPVNLSSFLTGLWNTTLTNMQVQELVLEYHPFNSGFYRCSILKGSAPTEVEITWDGIREWTQYDVEYYVPEPSRDRFPPKVTERAKIPVQAKMVVRNFGLETPISLWAAVGVLGENFSFLLPDRNVAPSTVCPIMSCVTKNEHIGWLKGHFGSRSKISENLQAKLNEDFRITFSNSLLAGKHTGFGGMKDTEKGKAGSKRPASSIQEPEAARVKKT